MRPHCVEAEQINKSLLRYGKMLNGKQVFRIVFSDDLTEKRAGVFNKFHGEIWVGQDKGIQEVPKYGYIKGCWVLERYTMVPNHEVLNYDNYEPAYAFRDKDQKYLPPLLSICEVVIQGILQPKGLTPEQEMSIVEEREKKRIEKDIMLLEEKRPNFMVLKNLGELVQKPSKEFKGYKRKRPSVLPSRTKS